MTLFEIKEALQARMLRQNPAPYHHSDCNREMKKARLALVAALASIDDYYKHSERAVKLYCKHLSK